MLTRSLPNHFFYSVLLYFSYALDCSTLVFLDIIMTCPTYFCLRAFSLLVLSAYRVIEALRMGKLMPTLASSNLQLL